MVLSPRLSMITDMMTPAKLLLDVGCDHAYISIKAIEDGKYEHALAMDINKGPLEIAAANIREHELEDRIGLLLSDGLREFKGSDDFLAVIAGMGGDLMINIIKRDLEKIGEGSRLVLQPQSHIGQVRHFLHEQGFKITDDAMCIDNGKYYQCFHCIREKAASYEKECFYEFGYFNIKRKDPVLLKYLDRELKKYTDIKNSFAGKDISASEGAKKVDISIALIEEALYEMSK